MEHPIKRLLLLLSYVSRSSCTEYYFFRQTWANVSNNKVEYSEEKEEKSHSPFRNVLCLSQWLNPSPSAINPVSQCIKRPIPVPILHLHSGGSRGGTLGSGPPPPLFLDQSEAARRAEKMLFYEAASPLSQGLEDCPPLIWRSESATASGPSIGNIRNCWGLFRKLNIKNRIK